MSEPVEWRGPGSHVKADGTPKVYFDSRDQAKREMRKQELAMSVHLRVYKCAHCPGYHIGNLPRHNRMETVDGD